MPVRERGVLRRAPLQVSVPISRLFSSWPASRASNSPCISRIVHSLGPSSAVRTNIWLHGVTGCPGNRAAPCAVALPPTAIALSFLPVFPTWRDYSILPATLNLETGEDNEDGRRTTG